MDGKRTVVRHRVPVNTTLRPHQRDLLRAIGDGNASAGIRRLLELYEFFQRSRLEVPAAPPGSQRPAA